VIYLALAEKIWTKLTSITLTIICSNSNIIYIYIYIYIFIYLFIIVIGETTVVNLNQVEISSSIVVLSISYFYKKKINILNKKNMRFTILNWPSSETYRTILPFLFKFLQVTVVTSHLNNNIIKGNTKAHYNAYNPKWVRDSQYSK